MQDLIKVINEDAIIRCDCGFTYSRSHNLYPFDECPYCGESDTEGMYIETPEHREQEMYF